MNPVFAFEAPTVSSFVPHLLAAKMQVYGIAGGTLRASVNGLLAGGRSTTYRLFHVQGVKATPPAQYLYRLSYSYRIFPSGMLRIVGKG